MKAAPLSRRTPPSQIALRLLPPDTSHGHLDLAAVSGRHLGARSPPTTAAEFRFQFGDLALNGGSERRALMRFHAREARLQRL